MFMPGIFVEYQEPPREEEEEKRNKPLSQEDVTVPAVKALKHRELLKQFSRISVLDGSNYHIQDKNVGDTDGKTTSFKNNLWIRVHNALVGYKNKTRKLF